MKRMRGFGVIEIVAVLVALAVLIGAVAGLVGLVKARDEGIERNGHSRGVGETEARYTTRDNQKLTKALAEVRRLEAEARAREDGMQDKVNKAVAKHLEGERNAKMDLEILRAGVRDGTLLLRDPGRAADSAGCPGGGERTGSAVAGNPLGGGGRDAGAGFSGGTAGLLPRAEGDARGAALSDAASDFHILEAFRANLKVKALQLCRATLRAERQPN